MLKKVLLASVAAVVLAAAPQANVAPAHAANIKIKANQKIQIKPRPRIRVVKPKVRIRINRNRLARKKQQEPDPTEVQQVVSTTPTTPRENPSAVEPVLQFMPAPRPKPDRFRKQVEAAVERAPRPKPDPVRVATIDPSYDEFGPVDEAQSRELAAMKDVAEAARLARDLIEAARLGERLGMGGPFVDPLSPADDDAEHGNGGLDQGGPLADRGRLGDPLWGAGVESGIFGFIPNSNGTAPANANHGQTAASARSALAVTPDTIARALAGVASGSTDSGQWFWGVPHSTESWGHGRRTDGSGGSFQTDQFEFWRDGSRAHYRVLYDHNDDSVTQWTWRWNEDNELVRAECSGPHCFGNDKANAERKSDGDIQMDKPETADSGGKPDKDKPGKDATKLYDPDSAEGGAHPFHWIREPRNNTQITGVGGMTPGPMPQDPNSGQIVQQAPQRALLSQDDVLTTYDEDSRPRGGAGPQMTDPSPGPMPPGPEQN